MKIQFYNEIQKQIIIQIDLQKYSYSLVNLTSLFSADKLWRLFIFLSTNKYFCYKKKYEIVLSKLYRCKICITFSAEGKLGALILMKCTSDDKAFFWI